MLKMFPFISFCTTCKNRTSFLKQCYRQNLEAGRNFSCEFLLLDYNSEDDLQDWTRSEFTDDLKRGYLKLYKTDVPKYFHQSHAKNICHLLSSGKIVCNLDADNIINVNYIQKIHDLWDKVLFGNGSVGGRLVLTREDFMSLGGYEEALHGCAWDDTDLRYRAKYGLGRVTKRLSDEEFNLHIHHDDEVRTANHDPALIEQMVNQVYETEFEFKLENKYSGRNPLVKISAKHNAYKTYKNLQQSRYVANEGRSWGESDVVDFRGRKYVTQGFGIKNLTRIKND